MTLAKAEDLHRPKTCTLRNALKLRHGAFWNAQLARRFQKPYLGKASAGRCPLSKKPDSGTHGFGACTHRLVNGLYIERHNEASLTAEKAFMEGAKGGCQAYLAVLVAGTGWHGQVTGLCVEWSVPS